MFEHVKRWITSLSRFATLISCSGELQRIHFFKRQRAIVAELEREGLEPSPPRSLPGINGTLRLAPYVYPVLQILTDFPLASLLRV